MHNMPRPPAPVTIPAPWTPRDLARVGRAGGVHLVKLRGWRLSVAAAVLAILAGSGATPASSAPGASSEPTPDGLTPEEAGRARVIRGVLRLAGVRLRLAGCAVAILAPRSLAGAP